tara:strand:+ start:2432 stop:4606 length:2175 start_codon:yes stop_codon:yes gene_type:complete
MAITKINTPELFDLGATNTSLKLPTGDTASRPANPSTGQWRYNTTLKYVEYYDGSTWRQIQTEPGCTTDTVNYPPGSTVVAYYKLDYSARDESSNNYDGTTTDITYVNGSPYSQAAVFNGSSSRIDLPNVLTGFTDTYSFSIWVKIDNVNNFPFFASDPSSLAATNNLRFALHQNGNYYFDFGSNSGGRMTGTTPSGWRDGNWHHFVFVSTSTQKLVYVDGSLFNTLSSTTAISGKSTLTVGHYLTNYGGGSYDQIRIFSTALDSDQVTELYSEVQCPCTTNTIGYSVDAIGSTTNTSTEGYYKLDGNAYDSTANANNGTWIGTAQYTPGPFGLASKFTNNSSNWLDLSVLSTSIFSCSVWVKLNELGTTAQFIIGNSIEPSHPNDKNFNLYYRGDYNLNKFSFQSSEGYVGFGPTIQVDTWYHVCWSGNNGTLTKVSVNGEEQSLPTVTQTFDSSGEWRVGVWRYRNSSNTLLSAHPLRGSVDQVRIFSTALSNNQVSELYSEVYCNTISTLDVFGGSTGVALYQFENNANSTDSSTYNGTWTGTEAYVGGYFDKAASFNGSSNVDTNLKTQNKGTFSLWFNVDSNPSVNSPLVASGYGTVNLGTNLMMKTDGKIRVTINQGTSGTHAIDLSSSSSYADGDWHHLVLTWDLNVSGTNTYIYVDNSLDGSGSAQTGNWTSGDSIYNAFIGAYYNNTQNIIGEIDQVRIFNEAISSFEVTQLFVE